MSAEEKPMTRKPTRDDLGPTPQEVERQLMEARDVMGVSVLKMLVKVDADLNADGWDAPPRLFTVRRSMAPAEVLEAMHEVGIGGELFLLEVSEIGDAIFHGCSGEQITFMLNRMAAAFTKNSATASRLLQHDSEHGSGDLIGWLLVNEAWLALATGGELETAPVDDPLRVEIRFLLCVDITGTEFYLMHRRDTDSTHLWHTTGDGDGYAMGGRLTEALRALVEATAV